MKNDQLTSQPCSASWLTKPEWLRWIAHETGLVEPEYLAAVQTLLATFPPGWIEEQSRLIVSTPQPETEWRLHPLPGHNLRQHPVPLMMSGTYQGTGPLLELTRLGLDLIAAQGRIQQPTKFVGRLRSDTQFAGALFELEVLSHLQRAGAAPQLLRQPGAERGPDIEARVDRGLVLVEATQRSSAGAMVLALRVVTDLPPDRRRWLGGLSVTIKPVVLARSMNDSVGLVIAGIQEGAKSPTYDDPYVHVERDPSMSPSSIRFNWGVRTYAEDLGSLAYFALKGKEDHGQLTGRCDSTTRCAIALDLQSFLYAVPDYAAAELKEKVAIMRRSIIDGIISYLEKSNDVSTVLLWWQTAVDVPPLGWLAGAAQISSVSLAHGEQDVREPSSLYVCLSESFDVQCGKNGRAE